MSVKVIMCIVYLVSGILNAALAYYLANKPANIDKIKESFSKNQKQALKGLIEKKDAYEKEMTDEVKQKIEDLQNALTEKQNWYNEERGRLNKELGEATSQHQKDIELLAKEYEERKNQWIAAEQQAQSDLREKSLKEIQEIEANKNCQLEKLKIEYGHKEKGLTEDFLAYSAEINLKREALTKEIEAFENQKSALIERIKKENEVKNQIDFYHINVDAPARHDLEQLRTLALSFSKPNVIYKVIWETFYKAPMEALFKKVLGENLNKGGIYKITELDTEKVYIGRTVNFQERWRTHAKRGCGIDKINGLLYDEMMKKGLENFTFEVVEVCEKEEQPKREKYWIKFYRSDEYGFNQRIG